ncbi:MAG: primosomal protein N', partial [Synechocystis sp.]
PQVTLVGVVAADSLLNFADYRSAERGFQTLAQVSGRAGRGDEPGRVIVQTYTPQHPVIQAVKTHNYLRFVDQELPLRSALNYPPYGRLLLLRCVGPDAQQVENTAQAIATVCADILPQTVEILGPAPASILRIAQRYRWHILLKYPATENVIVAIERLRSVCPSSVYLGIDVDPLSID